MKYKISEKGLTILCLKHEKVYKLLNEFMYSSMTEAEKQQLSKMFITALGAAGILDFNASEIRIFKTRTGNLVVIIPRCAYSNEMLEEIEKSIKEFIQCDEKYVLDLCKTYLKLRPYLDK